MRLRECLFALLTACSSQTQTAAPTKASPVPTPIIAASVQLAQPHYVRDDQTPPWSLTASDGSGLVMTRVDAKAVFEGPLAFTELHLYFHNNEDRRREGTFQITLPPHAAVSRFAMESDGQWQEAEVVEKQLARRAYDDFLHRKQDPALLEKAAGNQFTAKVFPIPAKGDKHIVISYSQELPGARYVLPLRGLPKIERVDVELRETSPDGKSNAEKLSERNWQPDRDFVSSAPVAAAAIESGTLFAGQLVLDDQTTGDDKPAGITLLIDTSASRALGFANYIKNVHELVAKLRARYGDALPLDVIAFDQDSETIFSGAAKDYGDAADAKLKERGAAGASDVSQALASLGAPKSRVVIVTDGVITAGAEHAELDAAVKALAAKHAERVDVVLAGGLRDAEVAGELVHAGLPHTGAVLDLDDGAEQIAEALGQPVLVDVPVEVAGASWVYPKTIASARAGTTQMVYARLDKQTQTLDVTIGGKHRKLAAVAGTAPLVERAVASAEIDEAEAKLATAKPDDAKELRAAIVKKSLAARVVSSQTSMLVLESDADYARYGIDRKSLADVLVIGPSGLEREHRVTPTAQIAQPQPPPRHMDDGDFRAPRTKMVRVTEEKAKEKVEVDDKKVADKDVADPWDGAKGAGMGSAANIPTTTTTTSPMPEAKPDAAPPRETGPALAPPPPPRPEPSPPAMHAERAMRVARPPADSIASGGEASGFGEGAIDDGSRAPWPPADKPSALVGDLAAIEHALARHDLDTALTKARAWHEREPGDVRALIGLGDALEANGNLPTAARIYGSIIDLFPGRADMRRFAGERLARLHSKDAAIDPLMIDTYRRAVADRPDHLTGHRLLAYALVRAGKPAEAFAAILAGIDQPYPPGRFAGGDRVLADDVGMIAAAYLAAEPAKKKDIMAELGKRHLALATKPSTRFIMYWETDGNDVDFHIQDAAGNHAWYGHLPLASGGELYADITTGYGPECFAIPGIPKAGPYHLSIDYYSQGPMGYGMGLLEIQRFDGKGKLAFEDRPYVIMNDHAFVDLGSWKP